jgi:ABC-type uncharacterized transport system auxiliary subunit
MTTATDLRSPGRLLAATLALCLALTIAGCSLSRPAPQKAAFLIDPPAPAAVDRTESATLRIGAVGVAAPYRGKAFVRRTSALAYEVDFYSEFLVAPAAMIGEATARGLERAGVFAKVVPPGALPEGDWSLDAFVATLHADLREPAKPVAEMEVTYFLTRNDGVSLTPVWSRDYRSRIPIAEATAEGYARALSAALGEILAELARDLEQATARAR